MNICFFLQRRRKIEMEKGGNNWTRKIFFAGEKKNREGNKENTKGEGHGGKHLKRGKIFGERKFLEDMKMEEKEENIFWRRRRRIEKEEEENVWRMKIFFFRRRRKMRKLFGKEKYFLAEEKKNREGNGPKKAFPQFGNGGGMKNSFSKFRMKNHSISVTGINVIHNEAVNK